MKLIHAREVKAENRPHPEREAVADSSSLTRTTYMLTSRFATTQSSICTLQLLSCRVQSRDLQSCRLSAPIPLDHEGSRVCRSAMLLCLRFGVENGRDEGGFLTLAKAQVSRHVGLTPLGQSILWTVRGACGTCLSPEARHAITGASGGCSSVDRGDAS